MKQCVDTYYVDHITALFLPDELKLARVVLMFKSSDSSKITNYTPI